MNGRVYIVDDDADVREALTRLLKTHGIDVAAYPSAEAFLEKVSDEEHGCILLDVRLPQMTGLQLQRQLNARSIRLPIIFLSAHADVSTAVSALREGAFHFLEKPIDPHLLTECIQAALGDEAKRQREEAQVRRLRSRLQSLTGRERDVMQLVVAGLSNREIGSRLGISHRTVEIHRSRVMQKMHASTLLTLVEFAKALGEEAPAAIPQRVTTDVEPEL